MGVVVAALVWLALDNVLGAQSPSLYTVLARQGVLWMVANRHLPYDRSLSALFRDVQEIGGDAAFRLVRASHPLRDKQRGKP